MTTFRAQIRERVRRWFGLDPTPAPGSKADRDARRAARLVADARAWTKFEAAERERRQYDAAVESEVLRAQLERRRYL